MSSTELASLLKKAVNLENVRIKSLDHLDQKSFDKAERQLDEILGQIATSWDRLRINEKSSSSELFEHIGSVDYIEKLEKGLKAKGIKISGSFPSYEFPPFKLEISVESGEVKLKMGRKTEKKTAMAPEFISIWIGSKFQQVVNRPFNSNSFFQDLSTAYDVANRLHFRTEKIQWGKAVDIEQVYKQLTISAAARKDYSKEQFRYDLTRLRSNGSLVFCGYKVEFGTSRNSQKHGVVFKENGLEDRIATLTIYKEI